MLICVFLVVASFVMRMFSIYIIFIISPLSISNSVSMTVTAYSMYWMHPLCEDNILFLQKLHGKTIYAQHFRYEPLASSLPDTFYHTYCIVWIYNLDKKGGKLNNAEYVDLTKLPQYRWFVLLDSITSYVPIRLPIIIQGNCYIRRKQ